MVKQSKTRAVTKERTAKRANDQKKKSIQDIRVTSVQPADKKARNVPVHKMQPLNRNDKTMRALRKKLLQIEGLMKRQDLGETLDEQQLQKIKTLSSVIADMEAQTAEDEEVDEEEE